MRRTLLWIGGLLGGLILLVVVGSFAFFALGGAAHLRPLVEDLATLAIGRPVSLERFDADPGWELTTLRFGGVSVANHDWAGEEPLAELSELTVALRPKTLIWGPLELPRVEARDGKVRLVRSAEGETNWSPLEGAAETAAPESRGEFPEIGELTVSNIEVAYRDEEADVTRTGRLDSVDGAANRTDGVVLAIAGALDEQALSLKFAGGPFAELVEGEAPYPIDFTLAYDEVEIAAQGTIAEPAAFEGVDVRLAISGPNFADLYPVIPAALPATPPFAIEGKFARQGEAVSLTDFTGQVGDSDIAGTLTYDTAGERPVLSGRIFSQSLDFDDLAPLIGAAPDPEEGATQEQAAEAEQQGLFPDEPIPVERFRDADIDIELEAAEVRDATIPVSSLKAHFLLQDARLQVQPLVLGLEGGGTASGEIAVNARDEPPSADLDIALQDVSLQPWFKDSQFVDEMGGLFGGDIYLLGVGHSLAEIAATARGQGIVTFREGTVSGLLVEAAGLDVVEALALVVGDDVAIAVHCGGAGFEADGGRLQIRQAFVDTSDSLLVAAGWLDLGEQTLDLQIEAESKDFSLIDMAAPVRISGAIADPEFAIADLDPLPFFELGDQENIDCQAAYEQLARSVRPRS
ncbi:MAG: AsmA family protein [Tistlia sp.]|uniref:AsmA family protein n=1 Tax=Tistlia sp. TaxID=3057121 RepID=UPI0034A3E6BF